MIRREYQPGDPGEEQIAAMHKAWSRHKLEPYLRRWQDVQLPDIPEAFWAHDWRACDIGSGFGKYLLQMSEHHPERGFLGIDKGGLRGGTMLERFGKAGRSNLFGIHGNAIPILARFPPLSLHQITIFYPNPWWPAKHRKKRWPYHPLLPQLTRILAPGGEILLTSNEFFYLDEWRYAMTHHPDVKPMRLNYAGPVKEVRGRTHFEVKFQEEGTPCGEISFIREPVE